MGKELPDLSGLLGGLLSNPAALNALTGILGTAMGDGDGERAKPPAEEGEAIPVLAPPPDGRRGGDRECLLAALSPYLSEERRRAMMGACKLLEVIELLKKRN